MFVVGFNEFPYNGVIAGKGSDESLYRFPRGDKIEIHLDSNH